MSSIPDLRSQSSTHVPVSLHKAKAIAQRVVTGASTAAVASTAATWCAVPLTAVLVNTADFVFTAQAASNPFASGYSIAVTKSGRYSVKGYVVIGGVTGVAKCRFTGPLGTAGVLHGSNCLNAATTTSVTTHLDGELDLVSGVTYQFQYYTVTAGTIGVVTPAVETEGCVAAQIEFTRLS
jgi:hypothetical protein